jgi:hypothetical protein
VHYTINNFEFETEADVFISSFSDESVNVKMTIDQIRFSPTILPSIYITWLYHEAKEYIKSNKYIPYFAEEYFSKKIVGERTDNFEKIYGVYSYMPREDINNNTILADGGNGFSKITVKSTQIDLLSISTFNIKIGLNCPDWLDGETINHLSLVNKEEDYDIVYAEITFDEDYTVKKGHTYITDIDFNFGGNPTTRPNNMYWVEEKEFGANVLFIGLTDIPKNDTVYTISIGKSKHKFLKDSRLILSKNIYKDKILLVRYGTLCEGYPPNDSSYTDCYDIDNFKSKSFVSIINHSSAGDHYGDLYICKFKPKYSGVWEFKLEGDDSHQLEIDGKIICSAQSLDTVYGSIELTEGKTYTLIVRHFEGAGGDYVRLYFKSPNMIRLEDFSINNINVTADVWSYDIDTEFIKKRQLSSTGETAFYGSEDYSVDYLNSTSVNLSVTGESTTNGSKVLVYSIKENGDFTFDSTTEFDILKIQG